jgi:peptidoglycan hydrolase CwlO-like protein
MSPLGTGIVIALIGWILGVLTNALIAIFKSGRVEKKAVYILESDCKKMRGECRIDVIETRVATIDIRVTETEKQLDRGREDFKELRGDISDIKEGMAGLKSIVENKIETIILKSKG